MRQNPDKPGVYLVTTDLNATVFAFWDGTAWPIARIYGEVARWTEPPQRDVGIAIDEKK